MALTAPALQLHLQGKAGGRLAYSVQGIARHEMPASLIWPTDGVIIESEPVDGLPSGYVMSNLLVPAELDRVNHIGRRQ